MKNASMLLLGLILGGAIVFGGLKYADSKNKNKTVSNNEVVVNGGDNSAPADTTAKTTLSKSPILGDKTKAKVAIVEFSDYECPYCQKFETDTFDQIKTAYVDTGKAIFVYRNFPLDFHEPATSIDANAALCAQEIGGDAKYYDFGRLIYQNTGLNGTGMPKDKFVTLATQIGLDSTKFSSCYDSNKFDAQIKADTADGTKAGVSGTPAFVIGKFDIDGNVTGVALTGSQPFTDFQTAIDAELAK